MRSPLNSSFNASSRVYSLDYAWGSLSVQHITDPKVPLALDMLVTITAAAEGAGMMAGQLGAWR